MRFHGKGVVWDKENHKPLCRFVDGIFETDDERTIQLLKEAGYHGEKQKQKRKSKARRQEGHETKGKPKKETSSKKVKASEDDADNNTRKSKKSTRSK